MKRFYFFLSISVLAIFASLIATIFLSDATREIFFDPAKEHIQLEEPVKAIYMTTSTATSTRFKSLMDKFTESGGNAVVIDVEQGGGLLSFWPENEALRDLNEGRNDIDLKSLVRYLHKEGFYVIFRQVVFKDPYMAGHKPEWRIKDKWGNLWNDTMGREWLDPSKSGPKLYNLMMIEELAKAGADEIQLDYIRFPATQLWHLDFDYDETQKTRADVINEFLAEAKQITDKYQTKLAADVFGGVVWGEVDWKVVGQHIPTMSQYLDVLSPMTYPSHYANGFYGYYGLRTQPYRIVHDSIQKFVEKSNNETNQTQVRLWVQGFAWNAPTFGTPYIQEQITASNDAGGEGFMIWNASNVYTQAWPVFESSL